MKANIFKNRTTIIAFLLIVSSCKQPISKPDLSFVFLERNSYNTSSVNGLTIYRLNDKGKLMDGYYVVGNELVKWEEFEVDNGLLNGDYIIFHPNGEIYSHSKYLNGKQNGEEKIYFLSGKLKSLKTYRHDVLVSEVLEYFESGQVRTKSKIENGEIIESVTYDLIGTIINQMFIKDGYTIHQKIEKGRVFSEQLSSNYDNFEAMKFYNEDGSLKLFLRMLIDGDKNYLIELDENNKEIKRIDVKANPEKAMEYSAYFNSL